MKGTPPLRHDLLIAQVRRKRTRYVSGRVWAPQRDWIYWFDEAGGNQIYQFGEREGTTRKKAAAMACLYLQVGALEGGKREGRREGKSNGGREGGQEQ